MDNTGLRILMDGLMWFALAITVPLAIGKLISVSLKFHKEKKGPEEK